jgi:hypothetical protein
MSEIITSMHHCRMKASQTYIAKDVIFSVQGEATAVNIPSEVQLRLPPNAMGAGG